MDMQSMQSQQVNRALGNFLIQDDPPPKQIRAQLVDVVMVMNRRRLAASMAIGLAEQVDPNLARLSEALQATGIWGSYNPDPTAGVDSKLVQNLRALMEQCDQKIRAAHTALAIFDASPTIERLINALRLAEA